MGTLIVEVRRALIEGLSSVAAFQFPSPATGQIPRFDFTPRRGATERERVWTEGVTLNHSSVSMRATKTFRNEAGGFDVAIRVAGLAKDQDATTTRAVEIAQAVEDYVATHENWMDWGLEGLNALTVDGDWTVIEGFDDNSTLALIAIPIRYAARLT